MIKLLDSFFQLILTIAFILYIINIYNITAVMKMNIIISNSSNQPIYEQIVSQIKALIISGELNEGDALPSMRLC